MLELTGMGSVLRGIGLLYWLLAIGALGLAVWKGKNWQRKLMWASIAIVVFGFLPAKELIEQAQRNAYAREAWAYFKKLCQGKSGEKIYKTYTGVKSVLVVKPLLPATEKDLYDQFWYGDPYSNATPHDRRDISKADTLLRQLTFFGINSTGFDFVEIRRGKGKGYVIEQISPDPIDPSRHQLRVTTAPVSKFTISWEDISTPEDRKYWVAGSRLSVIDVVSGSIIAERIGYLIETGFGSTSGQRRPWLTARGIGPNGRSCPQTDTWSDRLFILKALKPAEE